MHHDACIKIFLLFDIEINSNIYVKGKQMSMLVINKEITNYQQCRFLPVLAFTCLVKSSSKITCKNPIQKKKKESTNQV